MKVINPLPYIALAYVAWMLVFKIGNYPKAVPGLIRGGHCLALFYLMLNAWFAFDVLTWLLLHFAQVVACFSSQPNSLGSPLDGFLSLASSSSGTALFFVCLEMGMRKRRSLVKYFILWPVNFFGAGYLYLTHMSKNYPAWILCIAGCIHVGMFLFSLLFYKSNSVINLLFEQSKGGNPNGVKGS